MCRESKMSPEGNAIPLLAVEFGNVPGETQAATSFRANAQKHAQMPHNSKITAPFDVAPLDAEAEREARAEERRQKERAARRRERHQRSRQLEATESNEDEVFAAGGEHGV